MCSGERDRREQVNKPSGDGQTVKGTMQENPRVMRQRWDGGWAVGTHVGLSRWRSFIVSQDLSDLTLELRPERNKDARLGST